MRSVEPRDTLVERAFARITESEQRGGNGVRLLRDASENYPTWLEAIRSARTSIPFENYIIDADETGREFADALAERAASGVRVYLL